MRQGGIVAVVTDGTGFWTELFDGGPTPDGTFARFADSQRYPSIAAAKLASKWWPERTEGEAATEQWQRMHRALCSWAGCTHQVVWVGHIPAAVAIG